MSSPPLDVIDQIAAVPADLDDVRRRRPDVREYAQRYYTSIFEPIDDEHLAVSDRWLIAAFVTRLTADDQTAAHYADGAREVSPGRVEAVLSRRRAPTDATPSPDSRTRTPMACACRRAISRVWIRGSRRPSRTPTS
jgi:uncharacterized protein YciW